MNLKSRLEFYLHVCKVIFEFTKKKLKLLNQKIKPAIQSYQLFYKVETVTKWIYNSKYEATKKQRYF